METFEALATRHSVRKFSSREVSRETIEKILEAANWAPSAKNGQSWRFYVLTGRKKDELADILEQRARDLEGRGVPIGSARNSARIMKEAPVLVVVTSDGDISGGLQAALERGIVGVSIWSAEIQGVSAAIENMLIAAQALGVGSLWICDIFMAYEETLKYLGVKQDLVAAVSLGYASGEVRSPTKRPWRELTTFVE